MIQRTYLLDTNTFSYVVSGRSPKARAIFRQHLTAARLCLSAVSEGELRFGLANNPAAVNVARAVERLLGDVDVLAWDSLVAQTYGSLRAECRRLGKSLSLMDMMIAAHARQLHATLVTHDQAFRHIPGLETESWAGDLS